MMIFKRYSQIKNSLLSFFVSFFYMLFAPLKKTKNIQASFNKRPKKSWPCPYSCDLCEKLCPYDALEKKDGEIRLSPFSCLECERCFSFCPEGIIHPEGK